MKKDSQLKDSRRKTSQEKHAITSSLLDDLLTEIEDTMIGDEWMVSLDTVLLHLEKPAASFYTFYYQSNRPMTDLPDQFSFENADILADYLLHLGYTTSVTELRRRGWFLSHEDYSDWHEFFVSVALSLLANHQIDEDDLEVALLGCMQPADAYDFYCEKHLPVDSLVHRTASMYIESTKRKPVVCRYLVQYVNFLFHQRVFRSETLYSDLKDRLHQLAVRRGWADDVLIQAPESLRAELTLLGFSGLPTERVLKDRYRTLLLQSHPDLNSSKEALQLTQKITDAYAKICSYLRLRVIAK